MTLAEAGTTAVATANATTVTTASFTPTAGSLVAAVVAAGNGAGSSSALGAVTDSVGGVWQRLAGEASTTGGIAEVWIKDAGASPSAQTVTYTPGGSGVNSGLVAVAKWYTGALPAAQQNGTTAVNGGGTSFSKAITPKASGSVVLAAYATASSAVTLTANGSTTIIGQFNGSAGDTASACRATAATTANTSVTVGFSNTAAGVNRIALAEILAAGPTLIASYAVVPAASSGAALTSASFTPANGELLIIKSTTWSNSISMGAPTGGSLTYTPQVLNAAAGFEGWTGIYSAVVSGSPGSMTVAETPSSAARCTLLVERWANATLAGTPVVDSSTSTGTGTLVTTGAYSVISWCGLDENSRDPAGRTYAGSGVEETIDDGHVGSNSVAYHAYQSVAVAGSTTYGVTNPTALAMSYAAIEVLAVTTPASGPPPQNLINNRAALARAFNW